MHLIGSHGLFGRGLLEAPPLRLVSLRHHPRHGLAGDRDV